MSKGVVAAAVAGIGEVKPASQLPEDLITLTLDVIELALSDAGLTFADVDGVVCDNVSMVPVLSDLVAAAGLSPDVFMAQTGGHIGSAELAGLALQAGRASTIVSFFVGKLARSFSWDQKSASGAKRPGTSHANKPLKANFELPVGFFPQPPYMAAMANRYLAEYGYEPDDLGYVVRSEREWAVRNPFAMKQDLLSEEEYLAKTMVSDPLRTSDCALINDGAVAWVMTTQERARDLPNPVVTVPGVATAYEGSDHSHFLRPDLTSMPSRFSGPRALRLADIAPSDLDVIELYDCFSITPVVQLEDIGVCQRGEALGLYRKGEMRPGGSIPVNTHGGMLSHSYIAGNHLIEAVKQLRGTAEAAQIPGATNALVTGQKGWEHTTLILQRA